MPGSRTNPRTVVFEVPHERDQQQILLDFRTAALGGVVALGTQSGGRVLVVIECRTEGDQWLVQEVVQELSPGARLLTAPYERPDVDGLIAPAP